MYRDFKTKQELITFAKNSNIRFLRSAITTALSRFATNKAANASDYSVSYNLITQDRKDGFAIWMNVVVKSLKDANNYKATEVLFAFPAYGVNPYTEIIER